MKEKWNELKHYPVLILFFAFIFIFMVVDGLWPKREISDLERRPLAQFPEFSWSSLIKNEWTGKYDKYTKDQIVGRDGWLKLHSRSESMLFQKAEIGGALIGKDNHLFTKMFSLKPTEERQLKANIKIIQNFSERHADHTAFMFVPSASLIYDDLLPGRAPMLNENQYMDEIFKSISSDAAIDLRRLFADNKHSAKLYYDTDHHWTTEGGAYLAYQEFCRHAGLTPKEYKADDFTSIPDFLGTTYAKCVLWNQQADTINYLELPNEMTIWNIDGLGELTAKFDSPLSLYDMEKAQASDKYGMFLHGNNGYSTIKGNGSGKLLVIKDSYANAFVPFLVDHYEQIGVIDPRGYKLPIDDLMEQEGYEDTLLLFNFQSFVSNNNLSFLMG